MNRIKVLLIAVLTLAISITMKAGENDWYFFLSPSYYINPIARNLHQGLSLGFEKEISRRQIAGFSIVAREKSLYTQGSFAIADYSLTGFYKSALWSGKNDNIHLSMGGNIGSGKSKGFTFGLNLGIEYSISLSNRMKLFVAQENLLVFRSDNLLLSGLSLGIKIPLSL